MADLTGFSRIQTNGEPLTWRHGRYRVAIAIDLSDDLAHNMIHCCKIPFAQCADATVKCCYEAEKQPNRERAAPKHAQRIGRKVRSNQRARARDGHRGCGCNGVAPPNSSRKLMQTAVKRINADTRKVIGRFHGKPLDRASDNRRHSLNPQTFDKPPGQASQLRAEKGSRTWNRRPISSESSVLVVKNNEICLSEEDGLCTQALA